MSFLLTTIITAVITFSLVFILKDHWDKIPSLKKYKVHHSVLGVILILSGFFIAPFYGTTVYAVGLGIFLSHGFEEMYFNHEKISKAFFIFITKGGKE